MARIAGTARAAGGSTRVTRATGVARAARCGARPARVAGGELQRARVPMLRGRRRGCAVGGAGRRLAAAGGDRQSDDHGDHRSGEQGVRAWHGGPPSMAAVIEFRPNCRLAQGAGQTPSTQIIVTPVPGGRRLGSVDERHPCPARRVSRGLRHAPREHRTSRRGVRARPDRGSRRPPSSRAPTRPSGNTATGSTRPPTAIRARGSAAGTTASARAGRSRWGAFSSRAPPSPTPSMRRS